LFGSQDAWLAHRQGHRAATAAPGVPPSVPSVPNALVDLEHSYRKPEEELPAGLQLLLYECAQCLQLFPSPRDVLEHQASCHLPVSPSPPPPRDHSYEGKMAAGEGEEEEA
ncbi:ZN574 protein, partial [Penelope pileata]|nr:ZN574 protein [Penelope pileata]